MIVRINIEFKNDSLRSQFLTETILKTVLKQYGFSLIDFLKINIPKVNSQMENRTSFGLIFENKKWIDEQEITKVLNCYPDSDKSLGIAKYGWTFGLVPFELQDASYYKDKIEWNYKHGLCSYRLQFN